MIIELQNFGPIKSFKFDTSKDMHAIFGKNNIGKSYAISAVYLILKGFEDMVPSSLETIGEKDYSTFESKIQELVEQKQLIGIEEFFSESLIDILNDSLVKRINNSFINSFDINFLQNKRNANPFSIYITENDISINIILSSESTKNYLKVNSINFPFSFQFFKESSTSKFILSDNKGEAVFQKKGRFPYKAWYVEMLFSSVQYIAIMSFENIFFLPVSRSGLYNSLSSFGAIFAELSRNRSHITRKIEIPNMTEPISDYFLNLNTIDKAQANEHYLKHFEEIEQEILKGKITLDDETKKYYYVPTDTDMRLELSFTSSMISEIAPIIAHLKYIIPLESDKPSILFIEEPEAHLHPEIQILLLEYFVKLSKGNVKIVMTSHSNYIFNKLSNLLIANKIDKEKLSVSLMKMTPEGSVIEEGAMQMDEYGIEDNNFVDVAEQLYEERMSLLEKL